MLRLMSHSTCVQVQIPVGLGNGPKMRRYVFLSTLCRFLQRQGRLQVRHDKPLRTRPHSQHRSPGSTCGFMFILSNTAGHTDTILPENGLAVNPLVSSISSIFFLLLLLLLLFLLLLELDVDIQHLGRTRASADRKFISTLINTSYQKEFLS